MSLECIRAIKGTIQHMSSLTYAIDQNSFNYTSLIKKMLENKSSTSNF